MGPGIFGFLGGIHTLLGGLNKVNQGERLAQQGSQVAATAFRNAGVASLAAAEYNVSIEQLNTSRNLDALSREIRSFTSSQKVAAASSGLSITSKSFLSVMNDTLDTFSNQVVDVKNSSKQAQKAILFEGKAAQVEFENRARAAEFQGAIASFQASQSR